MIRSTHIIFQIWAVSSSSTPYWYFWSAWPFPANPRHCPHQFRRPQARQSVWNLLFCEYRGRYRLHRRTWPSFCASSPEVGTGIFALSPLLSLFRWCCLYRLFCRLTQRLFAPSFSLKPFQQLLIIRLKCLLFHFKMYSALCGIYFFRRCFYWFNFVIN